MSNKGIKSVLDKANKAYRVGEPFISDSEFDALEAMDGERLPVDDGGHVKVRLPNPMGSMNKCKTIGEVVAWNEKRKSKILLLMPKWDGCSLQLEYRDGLLVGAWTRGDGIMGMPVLQHAMAMPTIPKKVMNGKNFFVFGEAIMRISVFNEKYSKDYKNPRNLVAGSLNKLEASNRDKDIEFIAFRTIGLGVNYEKALCKLCDMKFEVTDWINLDDVGKTLESLDEELDLARKDLSNYQMDGLILAEIIDDAAGSETEDGSLNPTWARAYKPYSNDNSTVEVLHVDWQVSKNGRLKPVVVTEPVELSGATVTNFTGHNAAMIQSLGIDTGAVIEVTRSGDVIPYIVSVPEPVEVDLPTICPSCGEEVYMPEDSVDLIHLNNFENCPAVIIRRAEFFFSALGVEGVRGATICKVYDFFGDAVGLDLSEQILKMSVNDWAALDGFTVRSGKTVHSEIFSKTRGVPREVLMHGSSLFSGLGTTKLKLILGEIKWDDLVSMAKEKRFRDIRKLITAIHGCGDENADAFEAGLVRYIKREQRYLSQGLIAIAIPKEVLGDSLKDMVVCFTGVRSDELESLIIEKGGKVKTSVTKDLTHLICKSVESASTKAQKAKSAGVKLLTLDEAWSLISSL